MNQTNSDKRKLLADLLAGKVDALRTYKRQQAAPPPTYRSWVIDERAAGGSITTANEQGQKIPMSETEFEQLPRNTPVWRIVDMTGGKTPPPIDGEEKGCS